MWETLPSRRCPERLHPFSAAHVLQILTRKGKKAINYFKCMHALGIWVVVGQARVMLHCDGSAQICFFLQDSQPLVYSVTSTSMIGSFDNHYILQTTPRLAILPLCWKSRWALIIQQHSMIDGLHIIRSIILLDLLWTTNALDSSITDNFKWPAVWDGEIDVEMQLLWLKQCWLCCWMVHYCAHICAVGR